MTTINSIHSKIVNMIESGTIKQKPKWHFVLLTLMAVFSLTALFSILLYFVSFMSLVLREHLIFEALSFGPQTVFDILHTVPPLLVVLIITVFLLLHVLVRHFAFAYTRPVLATLGAGVVVTMLSFWLVFTIDTESRIARFGEGRHIAGIDMIHKEFRDRHPPLSVRGTIQNIQGAIYTIQDSHRKVITFTVNERTRADASSYVTGDMIMVLLASHEDSFDALAIRHIATSASSDNVNK